LKKAQIISLLSRLMYVAMLAIKNDQPFMRKKSVNRKMVF
jgi:hypothetical protein